jgi:hypothetical protein
MSIIRSENYINKKSKLECKISKVKIVGLKNNVSALTFFFLLLMNFVIFWRFFENEPLCLTLYDRLSKGMSLNHYAVVTCFVKTEISTNV